MTAKIDLSGANVAFAGTIKGWKKSQIEARIRELGGELHKKPKKDTDIFIEGGKASYKTVHKALHLVRTSYVGMTQGALLGAPWVSGVELLGLVHPSDYEDARTHADNLEDVRALVVRERTSHKATAERLAIVEQCLQQTDDHPVLQQIENISLCFRRSLTDDSEFPLMQAWLDAASEQRLPKLKKIDLSGNQTVSFPDDLSRLLRALEKNNLHERLEAFVVPRDTAEDVLETLQKEGVPAVRAR